ncbi:MAG: O-antigen ligase family protein [Verrucomicrobia bacterium]|nr:MAG: O-antigen ligase family protein [Verrucomicrobiota bacterium]TAE86506.1 MAG: O-antigen ligase family protein [Verrucomicrobiota bacterium]TAF24142.1 MAG: O-antigen ligase family protein [Verrucomicrobiota bacterium]
MPKSLIQKLGASLSLLACFLIFPLLVGLGGSTTLWNWGPGLLVVGLGIFFLVLSSSSRVAWGVNWHFHAIWIIIVLLALRAVFSPVIATGAHDIVLMLFVLAGYLMGRVQDAAQSRALLLGLLVAVTANAVAAVMQMDRPDWNPVYPSRAGSFASGFFAHYNHAANFGLGASGLFLSAFLRGSGKFKIVPALGLATSLLTIFLSLSRGGNFSLVCAALLGVVLFSANLKRKGSGVTLLWVVVAAGGLVIVPLGKIAVERVASFRGKVSQDGGFADGGRLSFYESAWKLFLEKPLTGGGPGHFGRDVYRVLSPEYDLGAEPEMAHNELLQLLTDYGAPCALGLLVLVIAPIVRQMQRYLLGRSSGVGMWESLGLVGMLIQSNFDFVFHVAPCAFMAAWILGRISRGRWLRVSGSGWDERHGVSSLRAEEYYQAARKAEAAGGGDESFILAVRNYACAFLAGRKRAEFRLIVLLLSSKDEAWQRRANELTLREKMKDGKGMMDLMRQTVEDCEKGREGRRVLLERHLSKEQALRAGRSWIGLLRNFVVACFALALVVGGVRLTEISVALWKPLYQPAGMSSAHRFQALLGVQQSSPYLGLERKTLETFIDRLYDLESLEAKEYWADSHFQAIQDLAVSVDHDPVLALQVATVAGWAGDEWQAVALYDRAIALQAVHERVFMAHFFKGEYFHDLMLSFAAEENEARSREYAELALKEFQASVNLATYGGVHHQRRQELVQVCEEAWPELTP